MANRKIIPALAILTPLLLINAGQAQIKIYKYRLTQLSNEGCMAKGRVQDCSGPVMQRILADRQNAIPVLISQLTETARSKYQIADYWADTRSGDVAYVVLTDLFTDDDLSTFGMPAVPDWPTVMKGCDNSAQACWDEYICKNGRKSVQQAWMRAWNLNKNRIYWDPQARCFRLSKD